TEPLQDRMLGIGPITKSVKDARALYSIISKHPVPQRNLDNFTLNVIPASEYPLSAQTRLLLDSIFQKSAPSFETEREIPPYFNESATLWQEIMSIHGSLDARNEAYGDKTLNLYNSYIKERLTGKSDVHRYLSWALIGASLYKPSAKRVDKIREYLQHGDHILENYLK